MILSMLGAIGTVLLPRLSYLVEKGRVESFETLTKKSISIIMLLSLPISMGLFLLSKPLILLLSGEQYTPAIIPMKIITPIVFFISVGNVLGAQLLPVLKKENIALASYSLGAMTNIVLNFTLIPRLGAIGAAIGTVFAEFTVSFMQLVYLKQYVLNKEIVTSFLQTITATVIMGIFVLLGPLKFIQSTIIQLSTSFVTGAIIYGIVLYLQKNVCYSDLGFHDGYAIESKDLSYNQKLWIG